MSYPYAILTQMKMKNEETTNSRKTPRVARRDEGQAGSRQKERQRKSLERPTQPKRQGLKDYEKRRNGIDKRQWHLEDQVERWIRTQL